MQINDRKNFRWKVILHRLKYPLCRLGYVQKKNCLKNAVTFTRKLLSDSVFGVTPVFG